MKPGIGTKVDSDRFNEDALRLLAEADGEAARLRHEYVGTEHILLALAGRTDGVSLTAMRRRGLDPARVRRMIEEIVQSGRPGSARPIQRPFTSRTQKSFELADTSAKELGQAAIGAEHLLLGLLGESMNIAAQVLTDQGLTYEDAKEEIKRLIGD
jgi:ATP-dependent Clp protease ATP-binding subunit ClpC